MSDRVRIGVVGLNFGMHLIRTLANLSAAHLVAVADRRCEQSKLDVVGAQYNCGVYRDADEMFTAAKLDAVLICTSPSSREALVRSAVDRGMAVWIEKPFASDLKQASRLLALTRQSRAPVMCGFSFRFHPAVQSLMRLVQSDLGAPWLIHASYVFDWWPAADWWLWKPDAGNGFINENSCHLFDVVCAVAGVPIRLLARSARRGSSPGDNAASVMIEFEGGATANLTIGGIGARAMQDFPQMAVYTERGQATLSGEQHGWREIRWAARGSDVVQSITAPPEALASTRYTHALTHFLGCVRDRTPSASTAEHGFCAVAIAEAIRESARTGAFTPVASVPSSEELR